MGKKIEDTSDELLVAASLVIYVSSDMPPVLLQHGDADTICPIDLSVRFYHAAVAASGEEKVEMDIIENAEHGDSAFETAENMERICEFFSEKKKLSKVVLFCYKL